jgi:hypothetical protein
MSYDKSVAEWKAAMDGGGWIGVDLDGTLAQYTSWHGPYAIGAPVPKMLERVKNMLASGVEVRIFTARACDGDSAVIAAIQNWTERHLGHRLVVTCTKDYQMLELWDDRAVQVIPNTGERADGKE